MNDCVSSRQSPAESGASSAPDTRPLHALFAAQAARTPGAIAVETVTPGAMTALTYEALERRAHRVARALREAGVRPGTVVGVCLRREPDLLVALLGVWQAGAAYLPLDPDHPAERLLRCVSETRTPVVLTGGDAVDALPGRDGTLVMTVDAAAAGEPGDACPGTGAETGAADPASPAYVLYTSGSTGRPKGVMVPHGGIANRVRWLADRHGLGAGDRMLLKTTIGFDAAALEVFAPLISGGTVVLAPDGAERDPAAMVRAVADAGVTVLQAVPSVLRALADAPGWAGCGALRLIFSAGEPLQAELCHRLLARVPNARIWNTYGPTECSVDITEHGFDPAQQTGPVPIGRPLAGLRVLILDPLGRPVPRGGIGELHVGGVGLAHGYLGRPDLTAERFVPDPYGPPGARLYRTGDRARWRSDGALEYAGRLDQQVKVNGVRIEPGEVEAALAAHPRLEAAVVAAIPGRDGDRRLAAWVQARGTRPLPQELRGFLRRTLPEPLIPSVFVPVDTFPRTVNGKIDRSALPEPRHSEELRGRHVAPRSEAERSVARIWAEMLDMPGDAIGVHDDFFGHGGSSLLLTQLAERLFAATGRRIALRALLAASTVEEQAVLLAAAAEPAADLADPVLPIGSEPVTPVARDQVLPLSYGQEGMWLSEQMRPGSPEWIAPLWIRLPGGWTEETVRTALVELAGRHEALRTRYAMRDGEPVQIIAPAGGKPDLCVVDAAGADEVRKALEQEFTRGFDLERGPVWRALLVRTPGTEPVLVLSLHHIACDGWSSVILERDLLALGEAARSGVPADLPGLPVQYADHAVWQRRRLDAAVLAKELAHWRAVLDGGPVLDLPTDRPRPADRDAQGAAHTFTVPAALVERAEALGRGVGATLHQTLLTSYAVLLGRLSGCMDVAIGISVAGRHRPEVAQTVGDFLNTLVLRCRLDGDDTAAEAITTVRETTRDALAHQEMPFSRLVQELVPERDPSRTPLYQAMFNFQEEGRTGTNTSEADLEVLHDAWQSARTDVSLVVQRQAGGGLLCVMEYATALFDAATVERFAGYWTQLLESLTAAPSARLTELGLLPPDESARVLALGAPGPDDDQAVGPDGCAHTAFEETVRRKPDATAVVHASEEWSYAQLEARANRIAHRLRTLGTGPETAVATMLDRGPDLIACLLGVWKAGAVHVPLDPAVPDERLAHIMADADVRLIVSDDAGTQRLSRLHHVPTLALDTDAALAAADPTPPSTARSASRLAYILYTSGSTGRPKGVEVEHGALLRMLLASRDHLEFGRKPADAWLALAQPTFDISFTELVMPLVAGGRVVLAGRDQVTDPAAQLDLIERHRVTHLQVAPPHWRMLIDAGLGERPLVGMTGGEPCAPALARELAHRLTRFVNEYGLTETTIASTRWDADTDARTVPIGRPYAHTTARVLDSHLRLVPVGVTGELCIGGAGLARGYAGQPRPTAERFVPDPYGPAGARLYRTGDLARMLPDGTLVFAGRMDDQVKIRGRRVETGELQAVLAEHPGLADVFVTVHGTGDDARLVAYCVPAGDQLPADAELLDHCARYLPDYMLPTLIVPLSVLPLTRHNKVDVAALPVPDLDAASGGVPYVAPRGPVEETIVRIWAEVLTGPDGRAPRIGAQHDFFHVGGDSMRAARVTAALREAFDIALPLRVLFTQSTLAELAAAVESAVRADIAALSEAEVADAYREYHP
ncbi:amino acid adenylation domain-containing protein [Streptomyces platensis]|uniref:amino acid adenylation domain-containing protein n=1 Tax=Streptomyces platensis TaxID=58346 RepID=UPI003689F1F5